MIDKSPSCGQKALWPAKLCLRAMLQKKLESAAVGDKTKGTTLTTVCNIFTHHSLAHLHSLGLCQLHFALFSFYFFPHFFHSLDYPFIYLSCSQNNNTASALKISSVTMRNITHATLIVVRLRESRKFLVLLQRYSMRSSGNVVLLKVDCVHQPTCWPDLIWRKRCLGDSLAKRAPGEQLSKTNRSILSPISCRQLIYTPQISLQPKADCCRWGTGLFINAAIKNIIDLHLEVS